MGKNDGEKNTQNVKPEIGQAATYSQFAQIAGMREAQHAAMVKKVTGGGKM